jgi:dTDP-4-dehydrorhamnose 3,5-epimerase-like enzyme
MMSSPEIAIPRLMEGGLGVDDRGHVAFVNDFDFAGVKRFYMVCNHRQGFIRAWHAHRKEAKYVTVVQGSALVAAVHIDDWEHPSKDAKVYRFVLSAQRPAVLYVPAGYGNGFMSLTDDARLMFFSTSTVDESRKDDIRYDAHYWDPWQIIER